jgi:DNA-binding CsgD family transcriptional regulator
MRTTQRSRTSLAGLLPRDAEILSSRGFPAECLFAALDHFEVGVCISNRRLRYRAVNRALAEIDRMPVEAFPGEPMYKVLGPLSAMVEPIIHRVFSTGRPLPYIRHSGRLATRANPGDWLKYYFPLFGNRGRVSEVGVFVVELNSNSGTQAGHERPAAPTDGQARSKKGVAFDPAAMPPFGIRSGSQQGVLLSTREQEVLRRLATGKSNKEISTFLDLSVKTVEAYRSRLKLKLHTPPLVHMVHYAIRHKIVEIQG